MVPVNPEAVGFVSVLVLFSLPCDLLFSPMSVLRMVPIGLAPIIDNSLRVGRT
jgi:hypothetical protein